VAEDAQLLKEVNTLPAGFGGWQESWDWVVKCLCQNITPGGPNTVEFSTKRNALPLCIGDPKHTTWVIPSVKHVGKLLKYLNCSTVNLFYGFVVGPQSVEVQTEVRASSPGLSPKKTDRIERELFVRREAAS